MKEQETRSRRTRNKPTLITHRVILVVEMILNPLQIRVKSMRIIQLLNVDVYNVILVKWFLDQRNDDENLYWFRQ